MAPLWVQTILFLLLPVCKRMHFKASLRFRIFLQDEVVTLQNPADVPVYVQVLPLALMPNPSVFSGKLAERWDVATTAAPPTFLCLCPSLTMILFWFPRSPLGNLSNINIDTNTLEFQVHRNQVSAVRVIPSFSQAFRESAGWHVIASQSSCVRQRQHVELVYLYNRSSLCLSDIINQEQHRIHRGIHQTICVQPSTPAWRNQVIQREIHTHQ